MRQYSTDAQNRLIKTEKNKSVCINGNFVVDKCNNLIFLVNEPACWKRESSMPDKLVFKGQWKLDENHDLILVTKNSGVLRLSGEILAFESERIVFEVKSTNKNNHNSVQLIKLYGFWNSDKYNRIYFCVAKHNPDFLFFEAGWSLNNYYQIVYSYSRQHLTRKVKEVKNIVLNGQWQFNQRNQLTYIISKSIGSYFEFKVQLESPNLYPQAGTIKYRLGIGFRESRIEKTLSFYGVWKINRDYSLTFQIECGNDRVTNWNFGSQICVNPNNSIEIVLLNDDNNKLGVKLTYTFKFLKENNGEFLVRMKKMQNESGVEGVFKVKY